MKRIITFGTFDLLHKGHLQLLERAKALGDYLIVGVSTDQLNESKGKISFFDQNQRFGYINALSCVDEVFFEESLEKKDEYIKTTSADVLVMGDDWKGKFDWVSCEVVYLERTENVSSTGIKKRIRENIKKKVILFGDTYVQKHYDCALALINSLNEANIFSIITNKQSLPIGLHCDAIVYFNKPAMSPPKEYDGIPKILIDHGASHLKWFLGNKLRYDFFDNILTAGPDHVRALSALFSEKDKNISKARPVGFIKSPDILSAPRTTRAEICTNHNLDPNKPIILFAPTWYITANRDMVAAFKEISKLENHIVSLHPETRYLDSSKLNVADNINGLTVELMKHADCVISDTSSTIYEAAALGKPIVQILLKEYSDNNSVLYDYPKTAGSAELFSGGLCVRPHEINTAVADILSFDSDTLKTIKLCQDRVLRGTFIDIESGNRLISELHRITSTGESRERNIDNNNVQKNRQYVDNLFFSNNLIIAHGGGNFRSMHVSNSKESINAAARVTNIIEVDIVRGKDGLLLAHDKTEARYGFKNSFSSISVEEFSKAKYNGTLSTISLSSVLEIIKKSNKAIVFDIKCTKKNYIETAMEIFKSAKEMGVQNRIVLQAYSLEDFSAVTRTMDVKIILAVWKYFYKDPLSPSAREFFSKCIEINADSIIGLSIPYTNKHMAIPSVDDKRIAHLSSLWKRIYIHGAPMTEYGRIQRKNFGLYADGFSSDVQFRDVPQSFNWRHYLFLNSELFLAGIDNQVQATIHYMKFGKNEGRLASYDVPSDFIFKDYLDCNRDLKAAGISGPDTAKAHWTRWGSKEGRNYKKKA